ncbi:MAG: MarC family protein [Pseudomonadota bacterium]
MNIYSAAVTIFLVMDPLGNIPVFLSLLKQVEQQRRTRIILRESLIAFSILTLFLFCGKTILHSLNISEEALGVTGGIILFLIAIKMLFPSANRFTADDSLGEPFIVPMAIPLIAGPSAMTTLILFASQAPKQMGHWFMALTLASLVSTLTLLCATPLQKLLGPKVIAALERLMGMILTTIAIQMFLTGVGMYFKSIT